ncbi:oleate hydratase [Gemmiger formicilis]|uniref:oleate hydratase n=1 Tax=Gemmiger formicilis TaxID=745368 RepID=UPI00195B7B05|nr:oleate hydratase [Gemmiger formicilis]MBM6915822.1 oleate hydratase [Gemmiger formicilis]
MNYTNGNYEAFARPRKPKGVEEKQAWLVGGGLASLAAAAFLVRDAQMDGSRIHILEEAGLPGGACDGLLRPDIGFVIRGGREMENHYECLWDLFRSVPSLEVPDASVLDEFYWLNHDDPNYSMNRAILERGKSADTKNRFDLSDDAAMELMKLFFTPDEALYNKTIDDVLSDEFYQSNFWLYWQTMFAFETWHSALEMKLYLQRFLHHIGGLPDLSALKFTKYNQYESLILPLVRYLEANGVQFEYGVRVENVLFHFLPGKKVAHQMVLTRNGLLETIDLTENDLVFVTNGSCTEESVLGSNDKAPELNIESGTGASWELWKNIAVQNPAFGRPEKFCSDIEATKWESATVTLLDDRIARYVQDICKRDPYAGKVVTGGIVTVKDSAWLMSWTFNRQPHFKAQPEGQLVGWIYGLYPDEPGDFVGKPMKDCTGAEICMEWLYHLGVPESEIERLATEAASTVPCMMPYVTAFFMPREAGDRPDVVPEGCVNFAFLGQFAQTPRDTIFTTEYSVRTAMEAVYTLLDIERGVPEVFGSVYDVRCLLNATHYLLDGRKLTEMKLSLPYKMALHAGLDAVRGTALEELLAQYDLI